MIDVSGLWHYDGRTAIRHKVDLRTGDDGFSLIGDNVDMGPYRWSDLVRRDNSPDGPVYGLKERAGWRICFASGVPDAIRDQLPGPARYGRWVDQLGFWRASVMFLAVSAVFALAVFKAPDWLAPNIPFTWEKQMGDAMVGDFGGRFCNGPGGQAALDALVRKIDRGKPAVRVHVANIGMVNAVALPGGNIVLFRGLLQEAKSPDEIAGVLGHEIGHVRKRHVVQALMRQAGLSVLLGGFGGNGGGYLNAMLAASYSREAESAADDYAIRQLKSARISPDDTAAFFARMSAQEAKLGEAAAALGYVSSHPLSQSRERAFRQSKQAGTAYAPVIDANQWAALSDICHNDPKVPADDSLFF